MSKKCCRLHDENEEPQEGFPFNEDGTLGRTLAEITSVVDGLAKCGGVSISVKLNIEDGQNELEWTYNA